jgi:hypothetical protein
MTPCGHKHTTRFGERERHWVCVRFAGHPKGEHRHVKVDK